MVVKLKFIKKINFFRRKLILLLRRKQSAVSIKIRKDSVLESECIYKITDAAFNY